MRSILKPLLELYRSDIGRAAAGATTALALLAIALVSTLNEMLEVLDRIGSGDPISVGRATMVTVVYIAVTDHLYQSWRKHHLAVTRLRRAIGRISRSKIQPDASSDIASSANADEGISDSSTKQPECVD